MSIIGIPLGGKYIGADADAVEVEIEVEFGAEVADEGITVGRSLIVGTIFLTLLSPTFIVETLVSILLGKDTNGAVTGAGAADSRRRSAWVGIVIATEELGAISINIKYWEHESRIARFGLQHRVMALNTFQLDLY